MALAAAPWATDLQQTHGMISERARLVTWSYVVSDLIATTVAFVGAYGVRNGMADTTDLFGRLYPLSSYVALLLGLLPVWVLVFHSTGLYGKRSSRTLHTEIARLVRAMAVCGLLLAAAIVATKATFVSRPFIAIFLLLNALLIIVGRSLVRSIVLDSAVRRRVLIAGGRAEVLRAAASVHAHRDWGLEIVGLVSDGTWTMHERHGYPVLGTYDDIPRLVQGADHVIDEVLVADRKSVV